MARPLVELRDVTIARGGAAILRGLSLEIAADDFLVLVGPNGAGKTSLLRVLAGIAPAQRGRVLPAPGLVLGYVPQERELDPVFPLSALEVALQGRVARLGPWRRVGAADVARARQALGEAGIEALAGAPFHRLSGGQKQRALIARALAAEPALLVLDEPTAGTDPPGERALMELLRGLHERRGLAVVMASHDLALVGNYARRIALVDRARDLFHVAPAAELLREDRLSELYAHPMRVRDLDGWRVVFAGATA